MMLSRQTTRVVLASIAGGASLADALSIGATSAESSKQAQRLRESVSRVSSGGAAELDRVGFDPPAVGEILQRARASGANAAALRAAAELALEALRIPSRGRRLSSAAMLMTGGIIAMGISKVVGVFVAPVFGKMNAVLLEPANLRAGAALYLGLAACLSAGVAFALRAKDSAFGLNLLSLAAPWWVFLSPSTFVRLASPRRLDRGGAILFAAAGAVVGLDLSHPAARGPAQIAGDTRATALARLGRWSRLESARGDLGRLFELLALGLLVLAAYSLCSYYLLIVSLPGLM